MNTPFTRHGLRLNASIADNGGELVIFQHGLCGSAAQAEEAFPLYSAFRRATLECRGHGLSEAGDPQDFKIDAFADDVAAFIKQNSTSPAIIGGISMGAAIALRLVVKQPQLVKALILARPAWFIEAAPENMRPNAEVGRLLANYPAPEARLKFMLSSMAAQLSESAPDNLASLLTFFAREPIATTAALLHMISSDGPGVTENDLRAIKVPTLIIATGQDVIHPLAHANALHNAIPNSKLVRITPKGVDKRRYLSEFQSTLLSFFESVNAEHP
jgi:pimeloyl-ACP methyl ester carboxylesterase